MPVPDEQLPVVLPEDCVPDGSGNPLAKRADFVNCACPKCGQPARRETDTMDTFVDSSWYYTRFACADQNNAMVDARVNYWLPVDQYIGGIEHAILHLLYSRFWTKVMRDLGLVKLDEPFAKLLTQGMVLNEIFFRKPDAGRITYFNPADVEIEADANGKRTGATLRADGGPVESGGIGTMSKSKNNGVDPQSLIEEYGADTARLFMMFASSPEDTLLWNDAGVEGASRFLKRLWSYAHDKHCEQSLRDHGASIDGSQIPEELKRTRREIHAALKQAQARLRQAPVQYGRFRRHENPQCAGRRFAGAGPELQRRLRSDDCRRGHGHPAAPAGPDYTAYLACACGANSAMARTSSTAPWPEFDPQALVQDEIELVLQVNGKLRGNMRVAKDADRAQIEELAIKNANVQKHIGGQPVKKIVVVPGRLVNVVV